MSQDQTKKNQADLSQLDATRPPQASQSHKPLKKSRRLFTNPNESKTLQEYLAIIKELDRDQPRTKEYGSILILGLMEEIGEIARAYLAEHGRKPTNKAAQRDETYKQELGDLLISIMRLAVDKNINLDHRIQYTLKKIQRRRLEPKEEAGRGSILHKMQSRKEHMTIKGGNIRKGIYILFKDQPFLVTKTEFVSPGKGSAFMRARLKSVKTGATQEFTFKSVEPVEELDIQSREMQYLYVDSDDVVFMDPRTYDQVNIPKTLLDDKIGFLTPELLVYILFYNEAAIGVRFPLNVKLKVTYAEDATAGNRINAPKKPVTVETGIEVQAPLFVKTGDVILIDTETGEYLSRANG